MVRHPDAILRRHVVAIPVIDTPVILTDMDIPLVRMYTETAGPA
jgi:hypothetical protein